MSEEQSEQPAATPQPADTGAQQQAGPSRRGRVITAAGSGGATLLTWLGHAFGPVGPLAALGSVAAAGAGAAGYRAIGKRRRGVRTSSARSRKVSGGRAGQGRTGRLRSLLPGTGRRAAAGRAAARSGAAGGRRGGGSQPRGRLRALGGALRHPLATLRGRRASARGGTGPGAKGSTGGRRGPLGRLRGAMGRILPGARRRAAGQGKAAGQAASRRKPRQAKASEPQENDDQATPGPAGTPAPKTPAAEPVPQTAPAEARPAHHPTTRGKPAVSSSIDAATEAIDQHIGSWEPQTAVELDEFLSGLPRLVESMSTSLAQVADKLGEQFPVEASVTQMIREIAAHIGGMTDMAGEAHTVHRGAHEKELERIENPRNNEQLWDVTTNS